MKLYYIYRGLKNEEVPKDVTRVIVDGSVTAIKWRAFNNCELLVCVIMGDNVKRIEERASIHSTFQDVGIYWTVCFQWLSLFGGCVPPIDSQID